MCLACVGGFQRAREQTLEDRAQLVPDGEARPLQLLGEFGGRFEAGAEVVEPTGGGERLAAHHLEDEVRVVRPAAGVDARSQAVEVAEEAAEVFEDAADELARLRRADAL